MLADSPALGTHQYRSDNTYFSESGRHSKPKVALLRQAFDAVRQISDATPIVVVDLGCGDGAVLREFQKCLTKDGIHEPDYSLYGVEGSSQAAESASDLQGIQVLRRDLTSSECLKEVGEFIGRKVDVVFMSSVLHELPPLGLEDSMMNKFFADVLALLAPGGRLVVREPAAPDRADEQFLLTLPRTRLPRLSLKMKNCMPRFREASYSDVFQAFEGEIFKGTEFPFRRKFSSTLIQSDNEGHTVQLSAAMLVDFFRKRTYIDTCQNWNTEMQEINARFSCKEIEEYALSAGF